MKVDLLKTLRASLAAKQSCAVVTALDGGAQGFFDGDTIRGNLQLSDAEHHEVAARIGQDRSGVLDGGRIFVRVYTPPPRMLIIGAVHIAQFLAPMARLAGFEVTVIDPREAFARSSQLADISSIVAWPDDAMAELRLDSKTAVVALTHDPKLDDPALTAALRSPAFYIGALGSRKNQTKRLERLAAAGFGPDDLRRIHGPVGLDINAMTPAEIAVSIVAQVIACLRLGARKS